MDNQVQQFLTRLAALKLNRANWETIWQEIAELVLPNQADFTSMNTPGTRRMNKVFDATGIHVNQLLAAGLFSMLTSSAQKWFEFALTSPQFASRRSVKLWMDMTTDITFDEVNRPEAGFNTATHECYLEYGAFGTLVMFITENKEMNSLKFLSLPLHECYLCENDDGHVDTLYRRYPRSVRQLIQRFGAEAVHPVILKLYNEKQYEKKINAIHVIEPSLDKPPFTYTSAYVDVENKHIMQMKGYYEQPFVAARFYKAAHETYGRGPGFTALPDIKMLQEIMKNTLRAGQKTVDPPLMVPDDGFLNPVRTTPGGLNYYRAGTPDRVEALNMGANPALGYEIMDDLKQRIREIFFVDQLQLNTGPQMTATEVLQRTEEKLRLMGPLLGRLQSEFLGPLLTRVFGLLGRMGKYPKPPEEIEREKFKVSYTSPIARAQEQTEANGLMRAMQVLSPFIEITPEIADNFNGDELTTGVFTMFSVSPKYLQDPEQVQASREQRSQQQQGADEAMTMKDTGAGLNSLANAQKTLTETEGIL